MATVFTVDASVFVASCRLHERWCAASCEFLRLVRREGLALIEPAILPVEIAAAIARGGEDPAWANEYAESVLALPYLTLHPLDEHTARRAVSVAIQCRLRGADALYVAAAAQYGARLVTLDAEQLDRAPARVGACKPDAATSLLRRAKMEP